MHSSRFIAFVTVLAAFFFPLAAHPCSVKYDGLSCTGGCPWTLCYVVKWGFTWTYPCPKKCVEKIKDPVSGQVKECHCVHPQPEYL